MRAWRLTNKRLCTGEGHVSDLSRYRPAQAQPDPAELGQLQALVAGVQHELLGIWEKQAWIEAMPLEGEPPAALPKKRLQASSRRLRVFCCGCMGPSTSHAVAGRRAHAVSHLRIGACPAYFSRRALLGQGLVPDRAQLPGPS